MSWLPEDFVHPVRVSVPNTGLHLRPIRETDTALDYPAVMGTKQEKIRRDLRSKIAEDRYPVGCRLPSYAEMERHYGVGTNVCQGAILDLEAEGLVQSQRGVGKFVLAQPVADSVPVMPSAQVRPEEALMSVLLGIRAAVDAALEHLESLTAFPPHRAH